MIETIIVVAVAALAVGLGVLWLRQRETSRREAFQALAARRGWSLTISKQSLGRPAGLRLSARSGPGWQAEARRIAGAAPKTAAPIQTTEFRSPEPTWADGTLLIGPALTQKDADIANQVRSVIDSSIGQRILGRMIAPDLAIDVAGLHAIPAPERLTVMASVDPGHRIDLVAIDRLLADWPSQIGADRGRPIISLGPDGFRVRLRHGTATADRMESFIDLALSLVRIIDRP